MKPSSNGHVQNNLLPQVVLHQVRRLHQAQSRFDNWLKYLMKKGVLVEPGPWMPAIEVCFSETLQIRRTKHYT